MLNDLLLRRFNARASSPRSQAPAVLDRLGLREGFLVADIGCGGGYFSLKIAERVKDEGKVFAVDTNPHALRFLERALASSGRKNVVLVEAGRMEALLPKASLDLIFARNVFHHLPEPRATFLLLKRYLRENGVVAILDHLPGRSLSFVHLFGHTTPLETIRSTLTGAGYDLAGSYDFLEGQSFTLWRNALPGR